MDGSGNSSEILLNATRLSGPMNVKNVATVGFFLGPLRPACHFSNGFGIPTVAIKKITQTVKGKKMQVQAETIDLISLDYLFCVIEAAALAIKHN